MTRYTPMMLNILKNKTLIYAALAVIILLMLVLIVYFLVIVRRRKNFDDEGNIKIELDESYFPEEQVINQQPLEFTNPLVPSGFAPVVESVTAVRLLSLKNPGHFIQVELPLNGVTSLGRDAHKNNVNFSGTPSVSAIHCQMFIEHGQVKVRDMKSRNGTYVNNQKITVDTVLKQGDQLQIGELKFRVDLVKATER